LAAVLVTLASDDVTCAVVGGLLSAHLLSRRASVPLEPSWPCSGPLLRLAEKVARKLLPGPRRDFLPVK